MADDCTRHRKPMEATDPWVDSQLRALPENQAGPGRHKCAYCAYEIGVERGKELERARIAALLGVPLTKLSDLGSSSD